MIGDRQVVDIARIYPPGEAFDLTAWLSDYQACIDAAKEGRLQPGRLPVIGVVVDPTSIEMVELPGGKTMTRPVKPVILIGPATYRIDDNNKIYSNVLGEGAKFWGVDVRYPTLFQPKNSGKALKILGNSDFPNGKAFRDVAKWLRKKTRPITLAGNTTDLRIGADAQKWACTYEHRYSLHRG